MERIRALEVIVKVERDLCCEVTMDCRRLITLVNKLVQEQLNIFIP